MKNISDRTRSQAQPNKEVAMQSIQQNYLDSPYQLENISVLGIVHELLQNRL